MIASGPAAQGTPVYDSVSELLLLQWVQLSSPPDTRQMASSDHGKTWSKWVSICGPGSLDKGACGGAVGPGTGIQLSSPGPRRGRLLFIGHYGAYGHDTVWFSDDHGKTYHAAQSNLTQMDEAQLVELPSGDLIANMRHKRAPALGRGVSRSTDWGSSWSAVTFDAELVSPVCAATLLRSGEDVYFANPASSHGRVNGVSNILVWPWYVCWSLAILNSLLHVLQVIRRSTDGVSWSNSTQSVFAGDYGYSCLTLVPPRDKIGLLWESDGPQCRVGGGSSCRTLFSTFDRDF